MSCDRGQAEIEKQLALLPVPISTASEYLDWLTKTGIGDLVYVDKSVRPIGGKFTKEYGVAEAKQIMFEIEKPGCDVWHLDVAL